MTKTHKQIAVILIAMISLTLLITPIIINASTVTTGLNLTVTPDKTTAALGDTITYTYSLFNSTSYNITNLAISDSKGSASLPDTFLGASGNYIVTDTYTIKISDFPGPFITTTNITGILPNGDTIIAQASSTVQLTPYTANLQIIKSADKSYASINETITYTYTIVNGSAVDLKDLVVNDDRLGAVNLSTTILGASSNLTATRTYTVNNTDLPGPLVNSANVTAHDPLGALLTATSNTVTVRLTSNLPSGLTKSEILQNKGVPGKGILNAPGLQRPFNPKSQAEQHADKDNKSNNGHNGK